MRQAKSCSPLLLGMRLPWSMRAGLSGFGLQLASRCRKGCFWLRRWPAFHIPAILAAPPSPIPYEINLKLTMRHL